MSPPYAAAARSSAQDGFADADTFSAAAAITLDPLAPKARYARQSAAEAANRRARRRKRQRSEAYQRVHADGAMRQAQRL